MMKISAPKSVARGEELRGTAEIGKNDLKAARTVEIVLYNILTYGKGKRNYSAWETRKIFGPREARGMFELPFEFEVDKRAPVTYTGRQIASRWRIKLKVDVIGAPDKEEESEIIVFR